MTTTVSVSGSSERWGRLWGARGGDWAEIEAQQVPTYEAAIRRIGLKRGQRVLDVGCGAGTFLRLAADHGAEVSGLDASEALLEQARRRAPEADLQLGDMRRLPYEDATFDVVTGFNSFFFADDMVGALREAGRVARPGSPVVIQVWGRPERCDLDAMKGSLAPFLPPSAQPPVRLWEEGVLERLATDAGLTPQSVFDASWAYELADEDELVRGLLSAALAVTAIETAGEEAVRRAIVEALVPYRTADGGYRLENEWHFVIASA